ncbi:TPM domain-containing protein [Pseudodesulfovibrio sp. zrk46]|uniref:TPM domain-containing protein n=1 Tax=Pseudodesulfovibrio sp. zrk46 TaxID=2725288 RepID=UPI001449FB43|nr:TPM domain-containing protein [Pseudodesulfovibrio sp. zrk46]QJB56073.1 hypothetical protein HFN16_06460 [Pseudodesulfovibrio sp. zrk46]
MKTLAQTFLTKEEQEKLTACVREVEKKTSGEIVPVIASSSYDYPRAAHLGGLLLGILVAVCVTMLLDREDMWTFLALFLGGYVLFSRLLNALPDLKQPFISRREMREEVEEAALTSFYLNGLHRTRDLTGVIIYVSVYERAVQILADKGINDKVDPAVWDDVVAEVTAGIKAGNPGEALCLGVKRCGEMITKHFPIKPDDEDELPNLIIEGEAH